MDWFGTAVVFAIVWWLILFMVLPFGAAPPDEVEPGMATSAPAKPSPAGSPASAAVRTPIGKAAKKTTHQITT